MVDPFSFLRKLSNLDSLGKDYLKNMMDGEAEEDDETVETPDDRMYTPDDVTDAPDEELDEAKRRRILEIGCRTERRRMERIRALEQRQEQAPAKPESVSTTGGGAPSSDDDTSANS